MQRCDEKSLQMIYSFNREMITRKTKQFFTKSLYPKENPYKTFIDSGIILYRLNNK